MHDIWNGRHDFGIDGFVRTQGTLTQLAELKTALDEAGVIDEKRQECLILTFYNGFIHNEEARSCAVAHRSRH